MFQLLNGSGTERSRLACVAVPEGRVAVQEAPRATLVASHWCPGTRVPLHTAPAPGAATGQRSETGCRVPEASYWSPGLEPGGHVYDSHA